MPFGIKNLYIEIYKVKLKIPNRLLMNFMWFQETILCYACTKHMKMSQMSRLGTFLFLLSIPIPTKNKINRFSLILIKIEEKKKQFSGRITHERIQNGIEKYPFSV